MAAFVSGAALLLAFLPLALFPVKAGALLAAFPRSIWPGRILTVVDVVWFAFYALDAGFPWVAANKWAVFVGALLLMAVVMVFVDELLSVRALGAFLLLAAQPLLDAAFPCASAWRLVVTVFAYALVIAGCTLVWSPYVFRKFFIERLQGLRMTRSVAILGAGIGLFMLVLSFAVYPGL